MDIPYLTGVGGPPDMPAEIVKILSDAFYAAVTDPGYVAWAKETGISLQPLNGEDFKKEAAKIDSQIAPLIDMMKADIESKG